MTNIFFSDDQEFNLPQLRKLNFESQNNSIENSINTIKPEYFIFLEASLSPKSADQIAKEKIENIQKFENAKKKFKKENQLAPNEFENTLNSLSDFFSSPVSNTSFNIIHDYGTKFVDDTDTYKNIDNTGLDQLNKDDLLQYTKTDTSTDFYKYASESIIIEASNEFIIKAPSGGVLTGEVTYLTYNIKNTNLYIDIQSVENTNITLEMRGEKFTGNDLLSFKKGSYDKIVSIVIYVKEGNTLLYFNPASVKTLSNLENLAVKETSYTLKDEKVDKKNTPNYTVKNINLSDNQISAQIPLNFFKF